MLNLVRELDTIAYDNLSTQLWLRLAHENWVTVGKVKCFLSHPVETHYNYVQLAAQALSYSHALSLLVTDPKEFISNFIEWIIADSGIAPLRIPKLMRSLVCLYYM